MEKSSFALRQLKILSVTGITVQFGLMLMTILGLLFWRGHDERLWSYLWFEFSVGVPLFGLLFVGVKMRDHLKAIEAALSARR